MINQINIQIKGLYNSGMIDIELTGRGLPYKGGYDERK